MQDELDVVHIRSWLPTSPDRIFGRGHPVADFLEAHEWRVLAHERGRYELDVHLPTQVKNARGVLFGGFTSAYIDLVAIRTGHSLFPEPTWLVTLNMRVDFLEPIADERFRIESTVVHSRNRSHLIEVRMLNLEGRLCTLGLVTLRDRAPRT